MSALIPRDFANGIRYPHLAEVRDKANSRFHLFYNEASSAALTLTLRTTTLNLRAVFEIFF